MSNLGKVAFEEYLKHADPEDWHPTTTYEELYPHEKVMFDAVADAVAAAISVTEKPATPVE